MAEPEAQEMWAPRKRGTEVSKRWKKTKRLDTKTGKQERLCEAQGVKPPPI